MANPGTHILYPVTHSVPGRSERSECLGRSKRRYVRTPFVTGYNMRVHMYPHNGTFRTLSQHARDKTVHPGTRSGNICSHVPICCQHTMVLRFHPKPEPSKGWLQPGLLALARGNVSGSFPTGYFPQRPMTTNLHVRGCTTPPIGPSMSRNAA